MEANKLTGSNLLIDDVYSVSVQMDQPDGTVCQWVEDSDRITDVVGSFTDLMAGNRFGVMMQMAQGVASSSTFKWTFDKHRELDPTETATSADFRDVFRELRQVVMVCRYPDGERHIGPILSGSIVVRHGESIECAHVVLHPVIQAAINANVDAVTHAK